MLYIIVPIYNVEKYLKECLDSIKNQSYKNFSAILINDGSTDSSKSIAEEYIRGDSRFYLINQENKGIGEARNTGIEYVFNNMYIEQNKDGRDYIGFVDSDDVISSSYFENLIYCLEKTKSKIAKTKNIYKFYDEKYDKYIFSYTSINKRGFVKDLSKNLSYKTEPWRCVISMDIMKYLRFPNMRNGEDVPFGICANVLVKNVAFCKTARYFYRRYRGSLSNQTNNLCIKQNFNINDFYGYNFIYEFFKRHNLLDKYTIPTDMIRPNLRFLLDNESYFIALKELIISFNLTPMELKVNPIFKIILDSNNAKEYYYRTMSFNEWYKNNFRVKLNREEKTIKFFGKTLFQSKYNKNNKWI
ncbi:MAG: glycosyltransferase family 2 protein [Helicobacteraceae bacterium]|nr:glycosyltransferase family 2 protein [Helicobacteraceae bacterium]